MRYFWKWLHLFAYRRWVLPDLQKPVGVPGNRDPQAPCDFYAPRRKRDGDWDDCTTDGHYLCEKCAHRKRREWWEIPPREMNEDEKAQAAKWLGLREDGDEDEEGVPL